MENLLLLPGPTQVPEQVVRAAAQPMINHRGKHYHRLHQRVQEGLRPIFGTDGEIPIMAGSGSGALESAVVNMFSPGERVLACVMGSFGQRFSQIAKNFDLDLDILEVEWGSNIEPEQIAERIKQSGPYAGVIATHNETSTGVLLDVPAVAEAVRPSGALLVLDSVSGLGGAEMRMQEWGVDCVVTSSQKALMTPPGIALAGLSERGWEAVERTTNRRHYWDYRSYRKSGSKAETPATPAVSLLFGMEAALDLIHEEGLPQVYERHRLMAGMVRAGIVALGLKPLAPADSASPTVSAVLHERSKEIVSMLEEQHGIVIAGGQGKLSGKIFRVGHMGATTPGQLITFFACLEQTLAALGERIPESGVLAAQAYWKEATGR